MASIQTIKIDKFCKNMFSKGLGLMFSRRKNIVLEFKKAQRIGLHMFFVFYPIDIMFLDANKKIIEIKRNLKPFRVYTSQKKANYIIEIGKERKKLKINDLIRFQAI